MPKLISEVDKLNLTTSSSGNNQRLKCQRKVMWNLMSQVKNIAVNGAHHCIATNIEEKLLLSGYQNSELFASSW